MKKIKKNQAIKFNYFWKRFLVGGCVVRLDDKKAVLCFS
jgi:hypothetical protein